MVENNRQRQARWLRASRKIHRTTGALLFVFFFLISVTSVLLGWKKHSGELLMPQTSKGTSSDLKDWLPIDVLHHNALTYLHDSVSAELSQELDRMDIRADKGIVKFIFKDHFWEIQLDGATGQLLKVGRRRSDFIEGLHDGAFLDNYFQTGNGQFKVIYSTITGLALLMFTVTGFWLWYGPKRMRKEKKNSKLTVA